MGAILAVQKDEQLSSQQRPGQHQLSVQQWSDVCRKMKLSIREQQVCRLLCDGLTRQKIADEMEISNRTVRHHMEHIHTKLRVNNRVGVVLRIVQLRDQLGLSLVKQAAVNLVPHADLLGRVKSSERPTEVPSERSDVLLQDEHCEGHR